MSSKVEKTIVIKGEDQLSKVFKGLTGEVKAFSNEVLQAAINASKGSTNTKAILEQQLKGFLGSNSINKLESETIIRERYDNLKAGVNRGQKDWEDKYGSHVGKGVVESFRNEAKRKVTTLDEQMRGEISEDSKHIDILGKYVKEIVQALEATSEAEVSSNREEVEKLVKSYKEGKLTNLSVAEEAKIKMQQDTLEKESTKNSVKGESKSDDNLKSTFLGTFAGHLAASFVEKLKTIPNEVADAKTGENVVAKLWTAVPFIGEALATAQGRHLEELKKYQILSGKLGAQTGRGINPMSDLGYGMEESYGIASGIASARGSRGNLQSLLRKDAQLSRAYGLDFDQLNKLHGFDAFNKTSGQDISLIIGAMNKELKGKSPFADGDFSRLPGLIEAQTSLLQQQSTVLDTVDGGANAQILGTFSKIFGDSSVGERVMTINNALSNPKNDYQQAMNYSVLSSIAGPNASYLDIKKLEEQGITAKSKDGSKTFLGELIKEYQNNYGKNSELGESALTGRLGLSYNIGEKVWKNADILKDMKFNSPDELMKFLGESTKSRAGKYTPALEATSAKIDEKFLEGMFSGIGAVMVDSGKVIAEEIKSMFANGSWMEKGAEVMANKMLNAFGGGSPTKQ